MSEENYLVSARKYRPTTFRSVVGQSALVETLRKSVCENKLAHAYLFCGPRGVGKTTCARIFAKTINCMHRTPEGESCNECESCLSFNEQRSLNIIEIDAASNSGVDEIRNLIEQVQIPPRIGRYKVYIIDEVHMLTQAAFNAFLKTLEEPPEFVVFILATTEKHKIIPTILSRCQIHDFSSISIDDIVHHLQYVAKEEGVTTEVEALNVIARKSEGGMRDALGLFDKVVGFSDGNLTYKAVIEDLNVLDYEYYFKLIDFFLQGNVPQSLLLLNEIIAKGFDLINFITGLSSHIRDIMVAKEEITLPLLEVAESERKRYELQAKNCSTQFLYKALSLSNECELNFRQSKNKRLLVELCLIKLSQLNAPISNNLPEEKKTEIQTITQQPVDTPKAESIPTQSTPTPLPQKTLEKKTPPASSISLSGLKRAQKEEAEEEKRIKETILNDSFTEGTFLSVWRDFGKEMESNRMLYNFFQTKEPEKVEPNHYKIKIETSILQQQLLSVKQDLLNFIARRLNNNQVDILFEVEEKEQKVYRTSTERYTNLLETNPTFKEYAQKLGLVPE
ncbi:MAG TPA: DNA polymerase III subunit gamma/tau [Porphyromonadaceae bacterium]|nr:DNA polymerase III subunit gamma/tau [Porphyromonadaceae bacterium]